MKCATVRGSTGGRDPTHLESTPSISSIVGGLATGWEALEEKIDGTRMVCNLGVILMASSDPGTASNGVVSQRGPLSITLCLT